MAVSLALPDGVRTKMFRALVDVLQADPLVSSIVNEWFVWTGKQTDGGDLPFLPVSKINLRLTPRMNELSWWSPDTMIGWLSILVETTIPNNDIDDMLNCQEAIENAFYPRDGAAASAMRNRFMQIAGINRGATTGLVMFTQPIYDNTLPERTDANFHALGEIRIQVRDLKARWMKAARRFWLWFLARFRLDLDAVCDASLGMGLVDYHDYPDSFEGEPCHFVTLTCKRCGKQFTI